MADQREALTVGNSQPVFSLSDMTRAVDIHPVLLLEPHKPTLQFPMGYARDSLPQRIDSGERVLFPASGLFPHCTSSTTAATQWAEACLITSGACANNARCASQHGRAQGFPHDGPVMMRSMHDLELSTQPDRLLSGHRIVV